MKRGRGSDEQTGTGSGKKLETKNYDKELRRKVFKYNEICSSLQNEYGLSDLHDMAKTMGLQRPEKLTKKQICQSLTPLATDLLNERPQCTNFKGTNLFGEDLKDVPPYLIYTFKIDKLDDDNGKPVQNATVCADLRDLIRYLDTTQLLQDSHDDELLRKGQYGTNRPELFSHQSIKLPHSVRQDIRRRWDLLTDFGKNPVEGDEEIVPMVPTVKQRVTDLYDQMRGYPAISIEDFSKSDASTLIGYLESASHYHIMGIAVEDVDEFKREPTVSKFIDFILRKADRSESRNTFMVALTGIINGEDLGDIRIPSPPSSSEYPQFGFGSGESSSESEVIVRHSYRPSMEDRNRTAESAIQNFKDDIDYIVNDDSYWEGPRRLRPVEEEEYGELLLTAIARYHDRFGDGRLNARVYEPIYSYIKEDDYKFIKFFLDHRTPFRDMSFLNILLPPDDYNMRNQTNHGRLTTLWNVAGRTVDVLLSRIFLLEKVIPNWRKADGEKMGLPNHEIKNLIFEDLRFVKTLPSADGYFSGFPGFPVEIEGINLATEISS